MSHELRTPLNSMLLLSKLMSDDRDGNLTDRQIEWAETMHSAGNDLLELINDILDLSKVEAGKLAITPEQVRLEELAASIERAFAHVAEDRGLGLDVAITAAAPREISSDARRIEQILKNLLSNAFKFTEVGGVRVELDAHPTGVAIAVIDSGPGIPVAQQRAIFEAFQQADGTISRRFGGTGLGLTISRALTELLGGTLELESEVGVGTTFRLVLPKQLEAPAPQPRAEAVEPAPIPDPPAAPYVLVIEDDVNFADTLAQMVRKRGLACCVTTTGQAGLAVQRQRRPIGVLLDWRLPDMSGREVLSAMRAERALWDVPVHVITGLDPDQVHTPAPVLTKPVAETDVAAAVQAFVDGEQTARVLVVDDHADQQLAIAGLLEGVDAAIVQVASGAEALQAIEDGPFDCVILDLGLPDMSGFELLEQIESIPVIVHTARELTAAEEVQLRRRAKSIIVKGQTPHERLLEDVQLFVRRIDEQREATAPAPVEAELDGHTVLVVDDDIRNVYALSASLEAAGVSVVMARDGQEALDRVRQNDAIDLVLMDVMMPVMDGLEATRRIRSELEKDRLPIIAVTAKAMPGDADQCLEAGADDYLPKPIDTDRLLSTVRAWLSGRPA